MTNYSTRMTQWRFLLLVIPSSWTVLGQDAMIEQQQQQQQLEQQLEQQPELIIGGDPAGAGEFPSFVHPVRTDCRGFCGGTLIHPDFVLSAAHCQGSWKQAGKVAIGGRTLSSCGNDAKDVIDVLEEYNHPDYVAISGAPPRNDIALIQLVRSTNAVTPAKWNTDTTVPPSVGSVSVTACGFGQTETGTTPNTLRKVTTTSTPNADCFALYNVVLAQVLCAGSATQGVCFGDSGGPLFLTGTDTVVGISSFVGGNCVKFPSGFARVSNYNAWIQQTICDHSSVKPTSCGGGGDATGFPFNIPILGPILRWLLDALLSLFSP